MLILYLQQNPLAAIFLGGLSFALLSLWEKFSHGSLKKPGLYGVFELTSKPFEHIKGRVDAWRFLFNGPDMIQAGYDKAQGKPYVVRAPDNRYLFVSSWQHIREIDAAPDSQLSLQAAAKQMLQPRYTMSNFNWFDKRGVEGTPLVRTLRTLLTNNIPQILPDIRVAISDHFDQMVEKQTMFNGAKHSPLYQMVLESVAYSNALAFFGEDLARNKMFLKAAMRFIEDTLLVAEIVRMLPAWMAPSVGNFLSGRLSSHGVLHGTLIPVTEERMAKREQKKPGHKVPQHKDCIEWVLQCSPRQNPWTAERVVHELMALWFGSVHVLTTTICFAVQDLCLHGEYVEPLRKELESGQWAMFEETGKGLPLLDSFLKESARTTPVESMSTRRMALEPFTLSDGTRLEVGEWICTPPRAMMRDAANYAKPLEFHGFRHVEPSILESQNMAAGAFASPQPEKAAPLTEVKDWQFWGTGRMACPGRFYAAAMMKTILALFITKYDMALAEPERARWFAWRTFIYPLPSTKVVLHPRRTG